MTTADTCHRDLPPIGQTRYARDVRTGWHVKLPTGWHLVLDAIASGLTRDVMLVLRDGPHGERDVPLRRTDRLMTRTPQEQIQHVEAERIARDGRGPVSRLHADDTLMAAPGDAVRETEGTR